MAKGICAAPGAADLDVAARHFFAAPPRAAVTPLGAAAGHSGSGFARVEVAGRAWCLRRWPPGFDRARLDFIHRVLARSRAGGFGGVPALATTDAGGTVLDLDGHLYDAQEWVRGAPLDDRPGAADRSRPAANAVRPVPGETLNSLAAQLARFHRSTADLRPSALAEQHPLDRQLAALSAGLAERCQVLEVAVRESERSVGRRVAMGWLAVLPRAVALAERALRAHPGAARSVSTLCHGDLWPRHVFMDGAQFGGFVDFERLVFSSPAFDLAQLVVHFNGWGARAAVVDAYAAIAPLGDDDRAVLPAAAALDLAGEGLWSLGELYGAGRGPDDGADRATHGANLRLLLASLEAVVGELEATTEAARQG